MSVKIQTRLKGVPLQRFKRYMEQYGLSEYQAAADLIIRGLMDFEREGRLEKGDTGDAKATGEVPWRNVLRPQESKREPKEPPFIRRRA